MITFALALPPLSDKQQLQLEETLLKVPHVDAFALNRGTGKFEITVENMNEVLRDAVAAIYGWASEHPGLLMHMKVVCTNGAEMLLGTHSPNDIIHFLATC
jgi:hypothetical protein